MSKTFIIAAASLLTTSCATSDYMGIDLREGRAPPDLQKLARSAYAGSKIAQFCLAQKFHRGDGVEKDPRRTKTLLRSAASGRGWPLWLNVPAAGTTPSRLELLDKPTVPGLAAAQTQLAEAPTSVPGAEKALGTDARGRAAEPGPVNCDQPEGLAIDRPTPSADNAQSSPTSPRSDLKSSQFLMDQIVAGVLSEGLLPGGTKYEEVSCALTLSGALRPVDAFEKACPRPQSRRIAEIRPDAGDLNNGYYGRCSASAYFLAGQYPQPSQKTLGAAADPLTWDRTVIERNFDDKVVHVEFDGPRRCATRVVVVIKERG